jgi:hypothetical protein
MTSNNDDDYEAYLQRYGTQLPRQLQIYEQLESLLNIPNIQLRPRVQIMPRMQVIMSRRFPIILDDNIIDVNLASEVTRSGLTIINQVREIFRRENVPMRAVPFALRFYETEETISKILERNEECPISLELIKIGDKYMMCDKCKYNFNCSYIKYHLSEHLFCPMCRGPWTSRTEYERVLPKYKYEHVVYLILCVMFAEIVFVSIFI